MAAFTVAQRKSNEKLTEYRKMEAEIQSQWKASKIFEANAPLNEHQAKPKYFGTFPYPYMNGKLHLGHSFSLSKLEFAIAYQRHLGKNCLLPLGFHCTGMPILACTDKLKREMELYGNPPVFPEDKVKDSSGYTPESKEQAKVDVDELMARDKSKAKKSKAQAKSGGAKYQWQIMRSNIKLDDDRIVGLSEEQKLEMIDSEIAKFVDPLYWFIYFPREAKKDLESFGLSADWRRSFITTDVNPFYDSFVRWQFNHLKKKNKIKFGKRYSIYSPKDGQPCMDHDRATGEGVQPQEYTLIKIELLDVPELLAQFKKDGFQIVLLAATLRPETMFGQTNVWLKPDMDYVAFKLLNHEIGVCSKRAAMNMAYQDLTPEFGKVDILATIEGQKLLAKRCSSPKAYYATIYTLPMMTIKDDKGTGVVTSVPSDSPDDWMALCDIKNKKPLREKFDITDDMVLPFEPQPIIEVPEYGKLSAVKVCEDLKIQSQNDRDKLTEAKERVYLKGFYDGRMLMKGYKGMKVNEVRKPIQQLLIRENKAIFYMEPENQIISRSGDQCVVALCDQWYLDYEDESWKNQVRAAVKNLETYSEETKARFEMTIDWLRGHACSRTYGLGTKLPWDDKWLVESLSDSTIYMAYYTIAHFLEGGSDTTSPSGIEPSQMTQEIWDYIFFGNKLIFPTIPIKILQKMRNEFLYWYPVDMRTSGKDLVPNHLTYSLYNHCAIWDSEPNLWPKSIRANGHLLLNGEKMSKSTGNFLTLQDAIDVFSADAVRFALADSGDTIEDANFVDNQAESGLLKLYNFLKWCEEGLGSLDELRTGDITSFADLSFENEMNRLIDKTKVQFDKMMFREALRFGFFEYQELRTKYNELCGVAGWHRELKKRFIQTQAFVLNPICPHIAQKIWKLSQNDGFIATASWPKTNQINEALHKSYIYLNESAHEFRVRLKDFQKPAKPKKGQPACSTVRKPSKATIYLARTFPPWQATICETLQELYIDNNSKMPDNKVIANTLGKKESLKKYMKKVMPFAEMRKATIVSLGDEAFNLTLPFDERQVLEENLSYLVSTLEMPGIELIIKETNEADDAKIYEECCPSQPVIMFSCD